jgi:hypothetical protein
MPIHQRTPAGGSGLDQADNRVSVAEGSTNIVWDGAFAVLLAYLGPGP